VIVRTGGKVSSADWVKSKASKAIQLLVSTANNQLELYAVDTTENARKSKSDEAPPYSRTLAVESPGHRADVRALALSSDDRMLAQHLMVA
jgi:U3 small nucleolar RNA-associated protein 12